MTLKGLIEAARSDAVGFCERGDEETIRAYVVVFIAVVLGPNADAISRYTGYPRPWVRGISREMRRRTLWKGETVEGHPWHPETDPQIAAVEAQAAKGAPFLASAAPPVHEAPRRRRKGLETLVAGVS